MNTKLLGVLTLLILLVAFLAFNIAAGRTLTSARLDLTQGRLYTLSEGARNIARGLDEPIRLTLYFSERLAADNPAMRSHGGRVREMLQEFERASAGKIRLTVIDPESFSDEEEEARKNGVRGLAVSADGTSAYLGLVGTNAVDGKEVIPLFDFQSPQADRFLEYEVARMLWSLANPQKTAVGLLASIGNEGFSFDPATRQPRSTPAWQAISELRRMFDIKTVDASATELPKDIGVLVLVHPKNLSDGMLFAIDQFVMKGGRLLVFVDPRCELDESGADPRNPQAAMFADKSSNLDRLLHAWGVEVVKDRVVVDRTLGRRFNVGSPDRPEVLSVIHYISLTADSMAKDDAVTGGLQTVNVAAAGAIQAKPPGEGVPSLTITPLMSTSKDSMLVETQTVQMSFNPAMLARQLLEKFTPTDTPKVIAARLSGKVRSAFPDGRPAPADGSTPPPPPPADAPAPLKESEKNAEIILVADVDMLADFNWVRDGGLFGLMKLADNGDFFVSAVDNLSGSGDLIGLRARGRSQRPFDRVEQMRREAEQRLVSENAAADNAIREAERKLAEAQEKRTDPNSMSLTKDQETVINTLRDNLAAAQREKRKVALKLNRDIDALGNTLRFVNIGLVPLVVTLAALGLGLYRSSRRRRDRARGA